MDSAYSHELLIASTAVQHCAALTKSLQQSTLNSSASIQKSDFSPVTIGDFAVQALLTSAIHSAFPSDTFIAEESADSLRDNPDLLSQVWDLILSISPAFTTSTPPLAIPSSKEEVLELIDLGGKNEISAGERTWVFDPIDGTATFLRGQQYAINCAFLTHGIEQIGIIGCPNLPLDSTTVHEDEIDTVGLGVQLFAVRNHGTWVRQMLHNTHILAAPTRIPRHGDDIKLDNLIWSDCSTYTSTILTLHQQIAERLQISWPGVDLFSSLMKYASLGLGRSHVVLRVFKYTSWRSNIWDHAGGVLIFTEAGGRVTDLDGGEIDFTKGRKMKSNWGLVCAPRSVHKEVLQTVREAIERYGPIPERKE